MPANVKDHDLWERAKREAGEGADYALVNHIYQKMGGTFTSKTVEKSLGVGPTLRERFTMLRNNIPGQVPRKSIPPSLTAMPGPLTPARMLEHTAPMLRPEAITRNLGMAPAEEVKFQKFVRGLQHADNEAVLRGELFQFMHYEGGYDPALRSALLQRTLNYYKTTGRSQGNGLRVERRVQGLRKGSTMSAELAESLVILEKAGGEGSRGGRVIGRTKWGRPIYAKKRDPGEKGEPSKHYQKVLSAAQHHASRGRHAVAAQLFDEASEHAINSQDREYHRGRAEHHRGEAAKLTKGGPYIGPHGGKYADPEHKTPWREGSHDHAARGVAAEAKAKEANRSTPMKYKTISDHANEATGHFMQAARVAERAGDHDQAHEHRQRAADIESAHSFIHTQAKQHGDSKHIEKAMARGGSYHRRVKTGNGYRYYYDEDKYAERDDAHISGRDAKKANCRRDLDARLSGKGAKISALKHLSEKYDPEVITEVIRQGVQSGRYEHDQGMVRMAVKMEKGDETTSDEERFHMEAAADANRNPSEFEAGDGGRGSDDEERRTHADVAETARVKRLHKSEKLTLRL